MCKVFQKLREKKSSGSIVVMNIRKWKIGTVAVITILGCLTGISTFGAIDVGNVNIFTTPVESNEVLPRLDFYVRTVILSLGLLAALGAVIALVEFVVLKTVIRRHFKESTLAFDEQPDEKKLYLEKLKKRIIFYRNAFFICMGMCALAFLVNSIVVFKMCCTGNVTM